jgi:hypothetical protein
VAEKNFAVILTAEIDLAVRAFKTNQSTHHPTQLPVPVSSISVKPPTSFRLNLIKEFSV